MPPKKAAKKGAAAAKGEFNLFPLLSKVLF